MCAKSTHWRILRAPSGLNYTALHYFVNCRFHGKIVIQNPRSVPTVPCIQRYHFTEPVLALAEGLQRRALPGEIRVQAAVAAALTDRFCLLALVCLVRTCQWGKEASLRTSLEFRRRSCFSYASCRKRGRPDADSDVSRALASCKWDQREAFQKIELPAMGLNSVPQTGYGLGSQGLRV
jgi:hypothetical protein